MKNFYIFIFSFVLLIGSFSCKKEEPTPVSDPPVFYFRGNVGSSNVNLEAGVNNYYMYSSFNQDQNNVYGFNGNLAVYNCTGCGNTIQIKINDFQVTPLNGNAAITTSLFPGYYSYSKPGGTATQYYVPFTCGAINGNAASYSWNFGDGTTFTSPNTLVSHMYTHPGIYHVKNTISFLHEHPDSTEYNIRFGIPEAELQGGFSSYAAGNDLIFNSSLSGLPPYSYFWDFGDGNTSTQSVPFHHTYASPGVYKVYLRVTDMNGGVLESERNCATQNYTGPYSAFYFSTPVPNANYLGLSNVTIEWKNAAGVSYTSNNAAQPAGSYFKLISVDDYQNNSNGQRTKKIHLNFKCKVYSATDSLQIDNGDAVIAVAYQ